MPPICPTVDPMRASQAPEVNLSALRNHLQDFCWGKERDVVPVENGDSSDIWDCATERPRNGSGPRAGSHDGHDIHRACECVSSATRGGGELG
jgi:hypothetical protein